MATLEEVIRQRLAEATKQVDEAKVIVDLKKPDTDEVGGTDVVDTKPKAKKELTKESLDAMSDKDFLNLVDGELLEENDELTLTQYLEEAVRLMGATNTSTSMKRPPKNDVPADQAKRKEIATQAVAIRSAGKTVRKDASTNDGDGGRIMKYSSKDVVKEDTVSSQVSALLEAEGLSEEFKTQAVTIFEAAVTDRVLQIEEGLKTEFDSQLAEAKTELDNDIDGFLSEAVQQWKQDNEVAIKSNFKSQLAESFMDGMKALIAEHNIEVPEDEENALEVALGEVDKLNEAIIGHQSELSNLQEQVNEMKAEKILESFKEKMTQTEFDRFVQLTESVKFKDESQYAKQLTVVLENFGSDKKAEVKEAPVVVEAIAEGVTTIVSESNSDVSAYAKYISKPR